MSPVNGFLDSEPNGKSIDFTTIYTLFFSFFLSVNNYFNRNLTPTINFQGLFLVENFVQSSYLGGDFFDIACSFLDNGEKMGIFIVQ